MKSKADCRRSHCPISFSLDILGDKWTLLILRDMVFMGKQHYGDFLSSGEGIATNILAARLEKLEKDGLLVKAKNPGNKTKHIYRLTDKGLGLIPLMVEMAVWGARHDPQTAAPPEVMRMIHQDKQGFIDMLTAGYKAGRFFKPE